MNTRTILAMAVVSLATSLSAWGQQRVDTRVDNNQVLDANTRVGSGGYNSARPNNGITPNQIVTGNVTGGRGFRGNSTGDFRDFQQGAYSPSDRFIRSANAVGAGGAPTPGNYAQTVYSGRAGSPPPGFVLDPYTGQYYNNPSLVRGSADIQYNLPPGAAIPQRGARGDTILFNGDGRLPTLMASPLIGMRNYDNLSDQDLYLLAKNGGDVKLKNSNDVGELDIATVRQLREEMRQNLVNQPTATNNRISRLKSDRIDDQIGGNPALLGSPIDAKSGLMPAIALSDAMPTVAYDGTPLPNTVNALVPPPGGAQPAGGTAAPARLSAGDPVQRNKTLAATRKKMAAQPKGWLNAAPGTLGASSRPSADGGKGVTDFTAPSPAATAQGPAPTGDTADLKLKITPEAVEVPALSAGQTQEGLKKLLESAEALMAKGKYSSAASRYDTALTVSTGDATILLGRSQAHLGAGFFAKAADDLRAAYSGDASLLLLKTDVVTAIGQTRLDKVVTDLKAMAVSNANDPMPLVLLAYVAHNSSASDRTTGLLDAALSRAPADPLIKAMRAAWGK